MGGSDRNCSFGRSEATTTDGASGRVASVADEGSQLGNAECRSRQPAASSRPPDAGNSREHPRGSKPVVTSQFSYGDCSSQTSVGSRYFLLKGGAGNKAQLPAFSRKQPGATRPGPIIGAAELRFVDAAPQCGGGRYPERASGR